MHFVIWLILFFYYIVFLYRENPLNEHQVGILDFRLILGIQFVLPLFSLEYYDYFAPKVLALITCFFSLFLIKTSIETIKKSNTSKYIFEKRLLLNEGPFKFILYPLHSGYILLGISSFLTFPSLGYFFITVLYSFFIFWRTWKEESYLLKIFDIEYREFSKGKKRYVPFLF